jgi:hypothetical protein
MGQSNLDHLSEMARAVELLRQGSKNPSDPTWRGTVLEASSILSRGVAHFLESLKPIPAPPRDMTDDHLRAQRFARVRVAEMSLYQGPRVKAGREARNLYGALKTEIDEARTGFQQQFLTERRGIPDYLHQELILALAHNDQSLLGPDYPGPLA